MAVLGSKLYFGAKSLCADYELHSYDGTTVSMVQDYGFTTQTLQAAVTHRAQLAHSRASQ